MEYFSNLCVGEDGLFDTSKLKNNLSTHFSNRLKEILKNYTGFQRICSLLVIRLLNSILSKGKTRSCFSQDCSSGAQYFYIENSLLLPETTLTSTSSEGYYGEKGVPIDVYHEITHLYHRMAGLYGCKRFMSTVTHTICNSALPLIDQFFPILSDSRAKEFIEKIKKYLEKCKNFNFSDSKIKRTILSYYADVIGAGFGNLLFTKNEIENLTFEQLCETERLAKTIYIHSTVLYNASSSEIKIFKNIWTDPEEMLTITGIVPLFEENGMLYTLKDRQNE
jgi:hypothetical protein